MNWWPIASKPGFIDMNNLNSGTTFKGLSEILFDIKTY